MRRGWIWSIVIVLAITALGTLASAREWGPYYYASSYVVASGNVVCSAWAGDIEIWGVESGDTVVIDQSYDLNAPGWWDRAIAQVKFSGGESATTSTTGHATGHLQIESEISPGNTYDFFSKAWGRDMMSTTCFDVDWGSVTTHS